MKTIFLSAHEKSITGGNKRFERLASFAVQNKDAYWVTIEREDIPLISPRILHLVRPEIPAFSMRLLWACIRDRKKIKALGRFERLIVFGETPLPAAWFLSWYLRVGISVGVRSNVPKRYVIEQQSKTGLAAVKSRVRYFFNDLLLRKVFKKSTSIIVQSPGAKSDFCENYSIASEKISVVPNNLPYISAKLKLEAIQRKYKKKPSNILFIGNGGRIKGFDNLMELIRTTNLSEYDFQFTVVGVSPGLCSEFDNVRFIERTDNVFKLMLDSDLLVVPSREDQFPNVVLEAMAVGLPVIGSDVDGIAYMINDQRYLFEPSCTDEFYAVFMALQEEDSYYDLICYIRERALKFEFDWEEKYLSRC